MKYPYKIDMPVKCRWFAVQIVSIVKRSQDPDNVQGVISIKESITKHEF